MKKIELIEATFRNIFSFGNTWQTLKFKEGLNIIQGYISESGKSNGAGKSSLTEILPFALFGKTIKNTVKAKIVNWYNEKQCEVRLKFLVDDISYEIRRGIKPNKLELYINGERQPKPASITEFQNQIEEEIIGMDFQTFQNLIYFSPNNMISIISAKKPEKRKFLESLFDLSVYSNMLKTVNNKLTVNKERNIKITSEKESIINNIEQIKLDIEQTTIPDIRKYKDKIEGIKFQLEELRKKTFFIDESSVERTKKVLEESKKSLSELNDQNKKTIRDIELYQRLIKELPNIEDLLEKRKKILEPVENLDRGSTDELEHNLSDIQQSKELLKEEVQELVKEIQSLEKEEHLLSNMVSNDLNNIDIAKNKKRDTEGICDSCGQIIDKELVEKFQKQEIHDTTVEYEEHKAKLDDIQEKIKSLTKERDEKFNKVKELSEKIKEIQRNIDQIKKNKELFEQAHERINDLPDPSEIESKRKEYEDILEERFKESSEQTSSIHMTELDVERYEEKYEKEDKELQEKKKHDDKIDQLERELKEVKGYYHELVALRDKVKKELEEKKNRKIQMEERVKDIDKELSKNNNLSDYLDYLKVSLKDENVKRFAISTLLPFLNEQANYYLSESGFPYIVSIDSWLDVHIRGLGVEEVPYGNLSGGETKCIDLAVQLACNDLASLMAKTSLNVMVLDEVLDSSVDSIGVQHLLNIIKIRQQKNGDSIYIITHRNELHELTFDNIVSIINEDGFSRVEIKEL